MSETQRDELAAIASESLREVAFTCSRVWEAWQYGTMTQDDFDPAWESDDLTGGMADAVLAAGYTKPRTVATVEERDALPVGTVIMTVFGRISARFDDTLAVVLGDERAYLWANLSLPATVLYAPDSPTADALRQSQPLSGESDTTGATEATEATEATGDDRGNG